MFKQGIDTMNFHALKELVVELMIACFFGICRSDTSEVNISE